MDMHGTSWDLQQCFVYACCCVPTCVFVRPCAGVGVGGGLGEQGRWASNGKLVQLSIAHTHSFPL